MLEFLFPFSMIAGVGLVSSPILIHLINRMRFKRIRWAAMEFLLKSQKRNRRKLIIEQLILLALRILLVLLIALIAARFLGFAFAFFKPQNRHHVVVLDDSPSMGDQWLEDGETRNSFKSAKKLIVDEIAKNAAQASKTQQLKVLTSTKYDDVLFNQRLNDSTLRDLGNKLNTLDKESALHVDLIHSVRKARKLFEDTPVDQRILYLVSDFREADWTGPNGKVLLDELKEMANLGVNVKFVDVAHPTRKETEPEARYHDNLAIVRLEPEARVVGQDMPPVVFKVTVANYSPQDIKNVQVKVRLNGEDRAGSMVPIPVVPANKQVDATFSLYLSDLRANEISAYLDPEETGLNVDNVRYTIVDVRKRVPILLIDGDNTARVGGDRATLEAIFGTDQRKSSVATGYEVVTANVARLEEPDLEKYPSIYLCNVRELSDKALQNLETYVRQGGSACFFLGDRVNAEFYNKKLFADGTGLFPAPLAAGPSADLTPEEIKERQDARFSGDAPSYFVMREPGHPVFRNLDNPLYHMLMFRLLLNVDRHYPIVRTKWNPAPGRVKELATLPNAKSVDDYTTSIQALLARLPIDDPRASNLYKAYATALARHRNDIRTAVANKQSLYSIARLLEQLLTDEGDEKDPANKPNLRAFWSQPEQQVLRTDVKRMQEAVQFGDPLLIESVYGKGRVLVSTTTLGKKWNNLADLGEVIVNFAIPLQKYLTSINKEAELIVGQPLDIYLDATRYDTKMRRFFKPEAVVDARGGGKPDAKAALRDMGALEPGTYVLKFYPGPSAKDGKEEERAFAFNIDTAAESNLARYRTTKEDLAAAIPNSRFYSLGSDKFTDLADKQSDLSESPWLYLVFLIVLIAEQALAVHLSFHLRGSAGPLPAGAARPQAGAVA
jgi:hypothetical protein